MNCFGQKWTKKGQKVPWDRKTYLVKHRNVTPFWKLFLEEKDWKIFLEIPTFFGPENEPKRVKEPLLGPKETYRFGQT